MPVPPTTEIPTKTTTITQDPTVIYKICADLSGISSEYEISYIVYPGDSKMKIASHGMNEETSNKPFYINASLIKSPGCNDTFWCTIHSNISFECIYVRIDMFPKECTQNDSDDVKKRPIIIIVIVVVFIFIILILAIVIIVLICKLKKKNETIELESQILNKKKHIENDYEQHRYVY